MTAWEENAFGGMSQNGDAARSAMLFDQTDPIAKRLAPAYGSGHDGVLSRGASSLFGSPSSRDCELH